MAFHRTSKSGLFLLEMVFVILFFALTSAICVRLFAQAHLTSAQSRERNQAMLWAQSAAEAFKSRPEDPEALAELLQGEAGDSTVLVGYDADWEHCPLADARYRLTVALSPAGVGTPARAEIQVEDLQRREELFRLEAAKAASGQGEEVRP